MTRARVRRRLRSLALLELGNIPLQAFIWFGVVDFPATVPNVLGFALFAVLLVEGAAYWLTKLRRLTGPLPSAFAVARVANVPVLIAGLLITGWAVVDSPGIGSWPGLVFAVVAALEHVNYFHTQLMYDTVADLRHLRAHGPRRAHLAHDLAAGRRAGLRFDGIASHRQNWPRDP